MQVTETEGGRQGNYFLLLLSPVAFPNLCLTNFLAFGALKGEWLDLDLDSVLSSADCF